MADRGRTNTFNTIVGATANNVQNTLEFYSSMAARKVRAELVIFNVKMYSGGWMQLPARPKVKECGSFDCLFDLRQNSDVRSFRCTHRNIDFGPSDLFVDTRLANLLSLMRSSYQNSTYNENGVVKAITPDLLYKYSKIIYNEEDQLHLMLQDTYKIVDVQHTAIVYREKFETEVMSSTSQGQKVLKEGFIRPQQQKISNSEGNSESLKEISLVVNKYAKKFIESKVLMNQFTSDLPAEIKKITDRMNPEVLTKQLETSCKAKRLTEPRPGLFAVNGGRLSTTFPTHLPNPTMKVVQKYNLTGPDKYDHFLGAGWFYHFNVNSQLHMFYAVGGSFNTLEVSLASSSATKEPQLDYRGSIMAWSMNKSGGDFKLNQFLTGDDRLKINSPAITYNRANKKVYIVGGITPEFKPTDAILEYDVETNKLVTVGATHKLRYNHTCCSYKGRVFIAGGINFNKYCEGTATNKIRPMERITDLHTSYAETDVEVFTPGEPRAKNMQATSQISASHLMIRSVSIFLPCFEKDMLVLFGGNCGVRMLSQGPSIAFDINTRNWIYFGENNLHREYVVGQDMAVSPHTLIVDFEGYQTENSATFMVADPSYVKTHIITFTAKGAEKTYRWVY